MDKQLLNDYKKWLLYSFDNQAFENYYNLFKALQTTNTSGAVRISKSVFHDQQHYTISLDHIDEELRVTEKQRSEFLQYLSDSYFKTDDIDAVMKEKTRQSDSARNHNFIEQKNNLYTEGKPDFTVKPHSKEITYFNIKLAVSLLFYLAVVGLIVYGALSDLSTLISVLSIVPVILFLGLVQKIFTGIYVGTIKGNSIRITQDQYPEIYKIIEDQAQKIKVKLPETYITSGPFNAFVMRFSRGHIMMIYSQIVETALRGNYDVLEYVIAHELCHIKQKHLAKRKYLLPSAIIPFLSLAYSRGCEYTCDRVGYHMSPKGSIEGILMMTTGKELHSKFNIELHIKNCVENDGFWTWLSEKFLTHPHLYKRLVEIKKYSQYN